MHVCDNDDKIILIVLTTCIQICDQCGLIHMTNIGSLQSASGGVALNRYTTCFMGIIAFFKLHA